MLWNAFSRNALCCLVALLSSHTVATTGTAQDARQHQAAEMWEVLRLGGEDIGYGHVTVRPATFQGQQVIQIKSVAHLRVKRFGQSVAQSLLINSRELPSGAMVDFSSSLGTGESQMAVQGVVKGAELHLTMDAGGKQSEQTLAWDPSYRSPFAIEQSLRRAPLPEGARREFQMLMPIYNQVARITLTAHGKETVKVWGKNRQLRRVTSQMRFPSGHTLTSQMWVDQAGEVLKTLIEGVGQETLRSTKSRALQAGLAEFDLGKFTVVRLEKTAGNISQATSVTYRATLDSGDVSELFVDDRRQQVRQRGDQVLLVVRRSAGKMNKPDERFTPADLEPNSLIQSDHARIRQLASDVAREEQDVTKIVRELTSFVHRNMEVRDTSQALASAAEVAESMEGDCTEHAVLLAALCRARQIPARVVIGLVYAPSLNGLAYHMWTEAWLGDRWVPADATRADGQVGAGHLKMSVSNLHDASPYDAFFPLMQAIGQLKLDVIHMD